MTSQTAPQPNLLPRFIALCGNPGAGKSEVQRILEQNHGVLARHDSDPLYEAAAALLCVPVEKLRDRTFKDSTITLAGTVTTVRKFLGELGAYLEETYGEDFIPEAAVKKVLAENKPFSSFSFDSVRRRQGRVYRGNPAGGVVVEVQNYRALPSGNRWDLWDPIYVDYTLKNMGTIADLEFKVAYLMIQIRKDFSQRVELRAAA